MIELSPEAEEDLRRIADWIRDHADARIALRVHDRVVAALQQLNRFPFIARVGRVPGTRELVISGLPYLAVYQPVPGGVLVLRIIHGAQLWPA